MPVRMKKLYVFLILFISVQLHNYAATPKHLIIYYNPYFNVAQRLQILSQNRGISTDIIAVSVAAIIDGSTSLPLLVDDPSNADPQWTAYWNNLRQETLVNPEPRAIMYYIRNFYASQSDFSNLSMITLLGNPLEIPPSTQVNDNDANSLTWGYGTDFYYSLKDTSDLVPDFSISRIPIVVTDETTQTINFNFSSVISHSILPIQNLAPANAPTSGSLRNNNVVFNLTTDQTTNTTQIFSRLVLNNTPQLASGRVKLIVTDTRGGYSLPDSTNYPFIITRASDSTVTDKGAYAFFSGTTTLQDVLEPLSIGKTKLLVHDDTISATKIDSPKISSFAAGQLFLKDFTGSANTTLSTNLGLGNPIVATIKDGAHLGEVYAITAFDITTGQATINTTVSDSLPTDLSDTSLNDVQVDIWNYVNLRTSLTNMGVNSASYVLPTGFVNDDDTSKLPSTGTLYNLTASANNLATKYENWDSYVWNGTQAELKQKQDYFHNLLTLGTSIQSIWDYTPEHQLMQLLNFRDSSIQSNPSLLNGYNVTKIYESNSGNVSDNALTPISQGLPQTTFSAAAVTGTITSNAPESTTITLSVNGFAELTLNASQNENASISVTEVTPGFTIGVPGSITRNRDTTVNNTTSQLFLHSDGAPTTVNNTTITVESLNSSLQRTTSLNQATLTITPTGNAQFFNGVNAIGTTTTLNLANGQATATLGGNVGTVTVSANATGFSTVSKNITIWPAGAAFTGVASQQAKIIFTKATHYGPNNTANIRVQLVDGTGQPLTNGGGLLFSFRIAKAMDIALANNFFNKGIYLSLEYWQTPYGKVNGFNNADFSSTITSGPLLPLSILSGFGAMDMNYKTLNIDGQGAYAEAALTTVATTLSANAGVIGCIGSVRNNVADTDSISINSGQWDKGIFTPSTENRHILARETLKNYNSSSQVTSIGSLWQSSINGFLDHIAANNSSIADRATAATNQISEIERWGAVGLASLQLPQHRFFPESNNIANEQPEPSVTLSSSQLRVTDTYDRYEVPVIEVPTDSTASVTFSIKNASDYSSSAQFRYTLVALPLVQPYIYRNQFMSRVSELDFTTASTSEEASWILSGNSTSVTVPFYPNWSREGGFSGNLKRGPSAYMLRVETLEPGKTGDVFDTQKKDTYTKEARMFFKIVNAFDIQSNTQFLLINNTDHDPYKLSGFQVNQGVPVVPSVAIRYYEHALDNYQYTNGTITFTTDAGSTGLTLNSGNVLFSSDNTIITQWEKRANAGDKIRIKDSVSNSYGNWHRINGIASDGSMIQVEDNLSEFTTSANLTSVEYLLQRAYTEGYASISYTSAAFSSTGNIGVASIANIIDNTSLQMHGSVRVGDFFKLLDERTFHKITAISDNIITLSGNHAYHNLYHYYSNNSGWGGNSKINAGSNNITSSYAIYPPNPSNSNIPNYLYQTWNIHNYNTTNSTGNGLHGDVTEGILTQFASGDTDGRRHKAVIWANDAGYALPDGQVIANLPTKNRNKNSTNDTTNEVEVFAGSSIFYLSSKDLSLLKSFLALGGRLFTGGQYLVPDSDAFYTQIGVKPSSDTSNASAELVRVVNDPISDTFGSDELSLDIGFSEGYKKHAEEESTRTHIQSQALDIQDGAGVASFNYKNSSGSSTQIGAIRTSGGENTQPFASVFTGFDFGNLSPAGARNKDKPLTNSQKKGRNLFMKNIIDWLRNPTRTSDDQAVKIIYNAVKADGSILPITLSKSQSVEISTVLHTLNGLATGVGPNQSLSFSVSGGNIYHGGSYQWKQIVKGTGQNTLPTFTVDPNVSQNEKITYVTGDKTSGKDILQLTAPDGSITNIDIITAKFPLTLSIINNGTTIVNDKIINTADAQVQFLAQGGDGPGSYSSNIIPGNATFTSPVALRLTQTSTGVIYTLPDSTVTDPILVTVEVKSGSSTTSETLTILPKAATSPSVLDIVAGGTPGQINASGGDSTYTFSTDDATLLTLTDDSDGKGTSVQANTSSSISTDPTSPTSRTVTATSFGTDAVTTVNVYSPPILQYKNQTTGNFVVVNDGDKIPIPSNQQLELNSIGGLGTVTWTIDSESLSTSSNVIRANNIDYASGNTFNIAYSTSSQATLNTGNTKGSIKLTIVSGSTIERTINMTVPLTVSGQTSSSETIDTGSEVFIKLSTYIGLAVTGGTAPYTWSLSPATIGSGFASTIGGTTSSSISAATDNTTIYFYSSDSVEGSGTIIVTDSNGNPGEINVRVTNSEKVDTLTLSPSTISLNTNKTQLVTISGGKSPFTITSNLSAANSGVSSTGTTPTSSLSNYTESTFYVHAGSSTGTGNVVVKDSLNTEVSAEVTVSLKTETVSVVTGRPFSPGASGGGGGCFLK